MHVSSKVRKLLAGLIVVVVAFAAGSFLVVKACNESDTTVYAPDFDTKTVDLLAGTWKYMPGVAAARPERLSVRHTGQAILTFPDNTQPSAATAKYVPNPPVNYYGTHLEMKQSGQVRINATLTNIKQPASMLIQSLPPTRYDESIAFQPGVTVTVDGANLTVSVLDAFDGTVESRTLRRASTNNSADISVVQDKSTISISVDGQKASFSKSILATQAWIGFDAGQSFDVTKLLATPLSDNRIAAIDMSRVDFGKRSSNGLYETAKARGNGGKLIGTAADLPVLMSNPAYTKFIVENFNEVEPELLAKFQALQPIEGQYEFGELDAFVDFAARHDLTVHGHTLVFNEANPQWLYAKLGSSTPEQARKIMVDHITAVVKRYDGKHGHGQIKYWDLTNEVLDPENFGEINKNNIWYKSVGPDYIKVAFQAARSANPQAKYGFNEYAGENDNDRFQAMLGLARTYKPDYVGFQAHFDEDTLNDTDAVAETNTLALKAKFAAFDKLGVKVRISEASVAGVANPAVKTRIYGSLMESAMTAPNSVGFNMWGATNNTGRNFYFTGSADDAGNDAPTTQKGDEKVSTGDAWQALRTAAGSR